MHFVDRLSRETMTHLLLSGVSWPSLKTGLVLNYNITGLHASHGFCAPLHVLLPLHQCFVLAAVEAHFGPGSLNNLIGLQEIASEPVHNEDGAHDHQ